MWSSIAPARLLAIVLALAALVSPSAHADVQYAYDSAGRLVQVTAADGSSAVYRYDSAGNITSIERISAGQLALSAFSPTRGAAGAQVTIHGSGFSQTPSANAISFNGTAAAVVSAAATELTVTVPCAANHLMRARMMA
jgi:YD repeat-containing protein